MRVTILRPVIGLIAFTCAAGAAEQPLWRIGTADGNYGEFAYNSDLGGWTAAFPNGVNFAVGRADPKKDFSAIHPGPADHWAGARRHPVRISFDLPAAPAGGAVLQIDLVDTHGSAPPTLKIDVNGKSTSLPQEKGTGDLSLVRPEKGKARTIKLLLNASLLKAAGNVIELTVTEGSWLLYDAVSLLPLSEKDKPAVELNVSPSIFLVEREGKLLQEFTVNATGALADGDVTVEAQTDGQVLVSVMLGTPTFGSISGTVHVPRAERSRPLTFVMSGGNLAAKVSVTQEPVKLWRIFVAPATHTDIGYTDIQKNVIALHNRNTDLALELLAEFPLYHWNLESSWAAQVWLHDRADHKHPMLYQAARERRLGVEAGYLNMLTGLCSDEELIRNLYYSARLHRENGVPFESFTLTDAPSHVWTTPTVLAGAGLKCISVGVNQIRAPLLKKNIHHKCPFWWEGPDGSKVLTWFTHGYSQAGTIGLADGVERMRPAIENHLRWWNSRTDYPYDAVLLHGAYSDNVAIGRNMAVAITEYNKRYAYPKVMLCANNDFFEHIERHYADKIPSVRGCGGSWWEDGAGSTAVETGINRVAHADAVAAEAVWAAATGVATVPSEFSQARFNRLWDNILLYDEHTWGAHNSITEPKSDFVQRQWAVKAQYATDAADQAERLLDGGLLALANRVQAEAGSVLVFNPSGVERTGVAQIDISRNAAIVDGDSPVPQQVIASDEMDHVTVRFVARYVPAMGYRVLTVKKGAAAPAAPAPARMAGNVLENSFYRVSFDEKTGAIAGIVDKTSGKDLVDANSPYKLGQVIYAAGGEEKPGETPWDAPKIDKVKYLASGEGSLAPGAAGSLFSSARSSAKLHRFRSIELETILYEQDKRIDLVYRLNKETTYEKEAVYIAFPVAGQQPKFRYEIAAGSVRPNEDHFPGACRDWFSVQRWVTVHSQDRPAVAWSPVDTPLITLCEMTPGKWLDELPITNGTIFAYVMNNYWFTNYKAAQDGTFTFRFSLTSDGAIDPAAACRFGEQVQAPMRAVLVTATAGQRDLPAKTSFCRVEPATVTLTTAKRADDGKGLILRVRETSGKPAQVTISTAWPGVTKASRCDLIERVQAPLAVEQGKLKLDLGANALATVRLE